MNEHPHFFHNKKKRKKKENTEEQIKTILVEVIYTYFQLHLNGIYSTKKLFYPII